MNYLTMSWDKPIEETILEYCNSMAEQWRTQESSNIHKKVRQQAGAVAVAYETVANKIKEEIKFRAELKK